VLAKKISDEKDNQRELSKKKMTRAFAPCWEAKADLKRCMLRTLPRDLWFQGAHFYRQVEAKLDLGFGARRWSLTRIQRDGAIY